MDKVKYIVVSQGIVVCEFYDEDEARAYVDKQNSEWNDYKEKCMSEWEMFADNECYLYKVINGESEKIM